MRFAVLGEHWESNAPVLGELGCTDEKTDEEIDGIFI